MLGLHTPGHMWEQGRQQRQLQTRRRERKRVTSERKPVVVDRCRENSSKVLYKARNESSVVRGTITKIAIKSVAHQTPCVQPRERGSASMAKYTSLNGFISAVRSAGRPPAAVWRKTSEGSGSRRAGGVISALPAVFICRPAAARPPPAPAGGDHFSGKLEKKLPRRQYLCRASTQGNRRGGEVLGESCQ
jgi:hypothetical protein